MYNWKFVSSWILSLLMPKEKCRHGKMNPLSPHDVFCPDCGKQVTPEWHLIRCDHCSTKRSGYYMFDKFVPYEKYCKRCGGDGYKLEIKEEIQFYDFAYAAYRFKEVNHIKDFNKRQRGTTKVWLEPEFKAHYHPSSSNMFSLQLIPATVSN